MNSLQRVLMALSHQEPDQVPLCLLLTMHGAKELGLSIKNYFSKPNYVIEGQLRLRKKYRNDCLYAFFYAPIEVEAFGAEVIYLDDGPPNSGEPFIRQREQIQQLEPPQVKRTPCLLKVLEAIQGMKSQIGDQAPIIGVVMSPFSLPVMQLGFDRYLDLIYESPSLFERLIQVNSAFCVEWANAQLEAGATAITYFDPLSSVTNISRELYLQTGFPIAKRTLAQIKGPTATHLASGRGLPIIDEIAATGSAVIGVSYLDDLAKMKQACRNKLAILGNLNGIAMRNWTEEQAEQEVKKAIAAAAQGGGFLLSDNHGEIPWQVPDQVLFAISNAVQQWGQYPLEWLSPP